MMLKITNIDNGSERKLILEGQLAGPWVDEFKKSWEAMQRGIEPGNVVIDLQAVTVISAEGEDALLEVVRQGSQFICEGVYVKHLMDGLASRGRLRCPTKSPREKQKMKKISMSLLVLGALLLFSSAAMAQEEGRHEVGIQGTGFFTKNSDGNGISQHATNTGGFLVGYRFYFNRWLAAAADYGYARNTQQNLTSLGSFNVQSNIHQATGALVARLPGIASLQPYALAGAGALVFDPTGNAGAFVPGAERQAKAAFVYGGGADYRILYHVSLRAEYRGLVYKRPDFGLALLNSDATAHTAQPSVGVVFRF